MFNILCDERSSYHQPEKPKPSTEIIGIESSFGFIFGKVADKVFAIKCVIHGITSPS